MSFLTRIDLAPATKVLLVFAFITNFVGNIYSAYEIELPADFEFLSRIALTWLLWWWLKEDSKRTEVSWPLDLGFFLYVAWIVIIPYHLFATRGLKGFVGILSFIGAFAAGWLAAVLVIVLILSFQ